VTTGESGIAEGGCLCGAVRYRVQGSPHATSVCNCRSCRLASGAPALAWAIFPAGTVEITRGATATFFSSPGVEWGFCPRCGTTLTYQRASRPGFFDVTTASLDDPEAFPPAREIWAGERLSWMPPHNGIPQFDRTSAG
jgi:hypothetical protein